MVINCKVTCENNRAEHRIQALSFTALQRGLIWNPHGLHNIPYLKDNFQSVLHTLESLFAFFFVLFSFMEDITKRKHFAGTYIK